MRSLLPLVDELVINVGVSEDGTEELLKQIDSPKLNVFSSRWRELSEAERKDGKILSEQTNLALERISGEWGFYLQADEVLHEAEYGLIKKSLEKVKADTEAIRFRYHHFKGDYFSLNPWAYRKELRVVKAGVGIHSFGDACSFKKQDGSKIKFEDCPAHIFHYGWVKAPETMAKKQKNLDYYYHDDAWLKENYQEKKRGEALFDEVKLGRVFRGTHPAVMQKRVANFPRFKRTRNRWTYWELYKKLLKYGRV